MDNYGELKKQLEEKKINLMLEINHVNGQLHMLEAMTTGHAQAPERESVPTAEPKRKLGRPKKAPAILPAEAAQ